MSAPEYFIGLMSGTSLDGVDGVLADFSGKKCRVTAYQSTSLVPDLRAHLLSLNDPGPNELHRAALAANALVHVYAEVVDALLKESKLLAGDIRAIGAHGQTVRHRPQEFDGCGYTWQLNNPALLAERTGIAVVADFRSRDVAAGGQGAPLVPAFHQAVFGKPDAGTRSILNVGGMSNLTVLGTDGSVMGFDCGPGNVLMDLWCQRHTGQPFDAGGEWAAGGAVIPALLQSMRAEPFFALPAPKSTGRDLFHLAWLEQHLAAAALGMCPQDVQATLLELTASTCVDAVARYAAQCELVAVCGGGALNAQLTHRMQKRLPGGIALTSTDSLGLPAQQVEAAAFAWLARQTLLGLPGNLPKATGAHGARILGAIYPA